jgi:O-acetyl-ADP-ribose deacetylase
MALTNIATLRLTSRTVLVIARGSVLDFEPNHYNSAIVNAANEGCLGGGGVDGAISLAGGEALFQARIALPVVSGQHIRCRTGEAKLCGPGKFGSIKSNHVIHAVGPDYNFFDVDDGSTVADELLQSAYISTLTLANNARLKELAFSLLSAGVFKGRQPLEQILKLGVAAIFNWARGQDNTSSIESIVLCAFQEREASLLCQIATNLGLDLANED